MLSTAASAAGSGVNPERCHEAVESQHPQRVFRKGDLGLHRGAQRPAARSANPPKGSTSSGSGKRRAMAFTGEIPAAQIGDDVAGELHPRFAAVVVVHLAAESGDLVGVALLYRRHRPEPLPHAVDGVGPSGQDLPDLVGWALVAKSRSWWGRSSRASRSDPPTRKSW